jgi:hypothetical protein
MVPKITFPIKTTAELTTTVSKARLNFPYVLQACTGIPSGLSVTTKTLLSAKTRQLAQAAFFFFVEALAL